MTEEKIVFFKRIYLAIKEFDFYGIFATEKLSVSIKYLLGIILIFVLVVSSVFLYQFHTSVQGAINYFNNNIEELSFSEGVLEINKGDKIEIQNEKEILQYVVIDTEASQEEIKKYEQNVLSFDNGMIILKDKIIYKNEILAQSMEYKYADIIANYPVVAFHKQDVVNFISSIDMTSLYVSIVIVMFIYLYVIYLATTLVDIVMLGVLGFIVARIAGMRIRFKATFNIGVYALTLPILLNLLYIIVNNLTGFTIEYFSWMYTTVSYIYVIVAILIIKTDFMNKQAELMKIIEEQEKVRQEIKQKEEEERKKEEEKKKDDNEPKEEKKRGKKKEEKPLGDDGLAPQNLNEG